MRVEDIMTRDVVTLYEEDSLSKIGEEMDLFRFRHLPVVDDGRLVGLVTHRDLIQARPSTLEHGHEERAQRIEEQHFVRDIMVTDVATTTAQTLLVDAAVQMRDTKLGCLPVIDDGGLLVGIVTNADFLSLAIRFLMRQ